jgi:hypothetical protein
MQVNTQRYVGGNEERRRDQRIFHCGRKQTNASIDEGIGISSKTLICVYQTKWCHVPYTFMFM